MRTCSNLELRLTTSIIGLIGFFSLFYGTAPIYTTGIILSCLVWIMVVEWPRLVRPGSSLFLSLTPFYPVMPFILVVLLNQDPVYRTLIPLMCLLTFTHDSAAYFFGNLCGKTKLAPSISPNKTMEGLMCGYIFTLVVFMGYMQNAVQDRFDRIFIIALITSTAATLGDLFESYLKRKQNVKDSGSLLPGHGGLLDRFDALLFVTVFFYFCRSYILTTIS